MIRSNEELVEHLIRSGCLSDERVVKAFSKVDRAVFVPPELKDSAYFDTALPVALGQTISQPLVVAVCTQALRLKPGDNVLEVGTGSGYQAAILAELVGAGGRVYSIERFSELTEYARERVKNKNVEFVVGDGSKGLPGKKFDAVLVTAACPRLPKPLLEQLKAGGRLVAPVSAGWAQDLVLVEKTRDGLKETTLLPVVFVPLIGEHGFSPSSKEVE